MRTRALSLAIPLSLAACGTSSEAPLYTSEVLTRHDAAGYSGKITVHDRTCALEAVSAAGPGISGTATLPKAATSNGCEWASDDLAYGATTPTTLPAYTLTITQTGQAPRDEQVAAACFQEGFAAPHWPGSPVRSPVELTWVAPPPQFGFDFLVTLGPAGTPPSDDPADTVSGPITNETSLVFGVASSSLPLDLSGFRVFTGPVRWTLHEVSSCYSVSDATDPFLLTQ